jgi:hypothetical protein
LLLYSFATQLKRAAAPKTTQRKSRNMSPANFRETRELRERSENARATETRAFRRSRFFAIPQNASQVSAMAVRDVLPSMVMLYTLKLRYLRRRHNRSIRTHD